MNNKKVFTLLAITSLLILSGCQMEKQTTSDPYNESGQVNQTQTTDNTTQMETTMQTLEPTAYATMETSKGTMKFKLFGDQTPELVKNFIELANQGKYEDVPFHRIVKGFMVQSGDFETGNGFGGHSYKGPGTGLADEYHEDLTHIYGALASAKSSAPNSIGSQFYVVNNKDGAHMLDGGYSVFGLLIEGEEVLDAISDTPTEFGPGGEKSTPTEEILIKSVTIEEA